MELVILLPNICSLAAIISVILFCNITAQTELVSDRYVAGHEVSHPELCPAFGSELQLMIFVFTAPSHFKQRQAIRMTWGDTVKIPNVSLAFIIGITPNESESFGYSDRSLILEEDLIYRDIIIGRFIDTYNNLTLKSLSMLEWMNTYCSLVPRMLKTDDDMFINVPKLLQFAEESLRKNITKTIWGQIRLDKPIRNNTTHKHFVTSGEFQGDVYPNFMTGPAYLMTSDVTRDLFAAAANEPYLRLEDVFITGVLATKLRIQKIDVPLFYNRRIYGDICRLMKYISVHEITSIELQEIWRQVQHKSDGCVRIS
ncbi:beta-1,3-galactosyltransferase 1-like [Plodia interpunctella]|uniref:beta-1,3-galactosyltransferase 1-like n=1 Tax=Plodia interpunctella TaxID=58824 RepID=UPI002368D16F|nr:beta-1,3-galactosyltransferase 1-like [Plodia interpunctella]